MPAYSCPSLPAAAIRAGLKPVLCDTERDCFRMSLDSLSSRIGPDTVAIIAVHLLGIPERIVEICEIARKIQNCFDRRRRAGLRQYHSHRRRGKPGASDADQHLGTFGDIGIFSFRRGKPLGLLGGGIILANNRSSEESIRAQYDSLSDDYSPIIGFISDQSFALLDLFSSEFLLDTSAPALASTRGDDLHPGL